MMKYKFTIKFKLTILLFILCSIILVLSSLTIKIYRYNGINYNVVTANYSPIYKVNSQQVMKGYSFILNYKGQTYQINYDCEENLSHNFMINEASKKWGRNGDHNEAVFALDTLINMGVAPSIAFEFVFPNINNKIDKILDKINIMPKDSKVIFMPNFLQKFIITQEEDGYIIDKDKLFLQLFQKFKLNPQVSISMTADKVSPKITKEDNLDKTQLLSRFSTSIANSSSDRQNNVKLALKQFNGMVVQPNQEVSFNKTTGRRTEAKGYKTAHIILDGLFVDGTGGGVCQSSTTLYNALLLADNIEILEANRHTLPVSYVKLGFDAMVAYGSSDLRFQNVGQDPIYIRTFCSGTGVYVEIYGKKDNNLKKVRRSEVIKNIKSKGDIIKNDTKNEFENLMDENGYYRQKFSKDGIEVQTYLDYFVDNKLVKTKKIRHTTYPAQRGIIYKGKPKKVVDNSQNSQNNTDSDNESCVNNLF